MVWIGWLAVGGILVCASASFFFALAETALFALGKWRARQLAEQSPRKGAMILRLLEQPSELLAAIALGNTLANSGMVVLALWPAWRGDLPPVIASLAAPAFILVGGEGLPKALAGRAPRQLGVWGGPPIPPLAKKTRWVSPVGAWCTGLVMPGP